MAHVADVHISVGRLLPEDISRRAIRREEQN